MKQLLLLLACCLALAAQQSKEKKFEACGRGTSHDCHCISRTRAVQDAYVEACRTNTKNDKDLHECMLRVPAHCSIVDTYPAYDDEGQEQGSAMSERCTMMCKKHDCLCDDGPRCHVAHDASEHDESVQKDKPAK
jgi:hypothetical protein